MNNENPLACVVISIKAMAFDYISKNNEHITVEEERAVCNFVNEITSRMINGKENSKNGGCKVD